MSDLEQALSKLQPQDKNAPQATVSTQEQRIQTKQASDHKKKVNAINQYYKHKQEQYRQLGTKRTDFIHAIEQGKDDKTLLMLAIDMLEITTDKAFITTVKNKLKENEK